MESSFAEVADQLGAPFAHVLETTRHLKAEASKLELELNSPNINQNGVYHIDSSMREFLPLRPRELNMRVVVDGAYDKCVDVVAIAEEEEGGGTESTGTDTESFSNAPNVSVAKFWKGGAAAEALAKLEGNLSALLLLNENEGSGEREAIVRKLHMDAIELQMVLPKASGPVKIKRERGGGGKSISSSASSASKTPKLKAALDSAEKEIKMLRAAIAEREKRGAESEKEVLKKLKGLRVEGGKLTKPILDLLNAFRKCEGNEKMPIDKLYAGVAGKDLAGLLLIFNDCKKEMLASCELVNRL